MSFWKSSTGAVIDGSQQARLIPDGTTAPAVIKSVKLKEGYQGAEDYYQVTYKLVEGDFKNSEVKQKIRCFDPSPKKRDKAVNTLMRLCKLCEFSPSHSEAPSEQDLRPIVGKLIGITIQEYHFEGMEGNWVSAIDPVDNNFIVATGVKQVMTIPKRPSANDFNVAYSNSRAGIKNGTDNSNLILDDDIPF